MTEIQGAIGRVQLKRINGFIESRNKNARYLSNAISDITGIDPPFIPDYCEPAFNYWIGRIIPDILGLTKPQFLKAFPRSKVLYPKPLYKTKLFQEKIAYSNGCPWSCPFYGKEIDYNKVNLPRTEKITQEIFALDIHPNISKEILDENIEIMKDLAQK
jgi:dTDP-4-amino-4,6-dideoxygalactose transaminase